VTKGSASDPLRVERRFEGDAVVLWMTGEIDMNTAPVLAEEFEVAIANAVAPAPVVADLSDVAFLGSAGLAVLLNARERCAQAEVPFRLVATGRPVLRSLEIAGLRELLPVYSTAAQAVE
jgi:anti-anti-sigma factor